MNEFHSPCVESGAMAPFSSPPTARSSHATHTPTPTGQGDRNHPMDRHPHSPMKTNKCGKHTKVCCCICLSAFVFQLGQNRILRNFVTPKSIRGTQGGYILSKKPNEIKLTNIFHAVDEKVKTVQCKKESKKSCNGKATKCVTHNLWDELETHINSFFEKKSLEDLLKNNNERRV